MKIRASVPSAMTDAVEELEALRTVKLNLITEEVEKVLLKKVINLAKKLGAELGDIHILVKPPVVVRQVNQWKRDKLIRASKQQQLTKKNLSPLCKATELKKWEKVKHVWTVGSKILARKQDGDKTTEIFNMGWKKNEEWSSSASGTDKEADGFSIYYFRTSFILHFTGVLARTRHILLPYGSESVARSKSEHKSQKLKNTINNIVGKNRTTKFPMETTQKEYQEAETCGRKDIKKR